MKRKRGKWCRIRTIYQTWKRKEGDQERKHIDIWVKTQLTIYRKRKGIMEYNDTWQDTTLDQGLKWDHRLYPDEMEQSKWGKKPLMKILDEQVWDIMGIKRRRIICNQRRKPKS